MTSDLEEPATPVNGGVEATRQRSGELFGVLQDEAAEDSARESAREDLVHLHLPLVEHCARRFRNRGEPFEDLVQVGTIGLLKSNRLVRTVRTGACRGGR